jgi:hypothetical protein
MKIKNVFLILWLSVSGCVAVTQSGAVTIIEKSGYNHVVCPEDGYNFDHLCGADYRAEWHCTATNSEGKRVEIFACCGNPLQSKIMVKKE